MYFSTISLLLVSTALHIQTSHTIKPPNQWKHSRRMMNGLPDDRSNCFCYPEGQLPTVHDLLDSQNNGVERIVIYLYKNSGSNNIKMYVPNSDKQVLIPDIPYESGDELIPVNRENVATLFYNSPFRIKLYNNRIETVNPAVSDSMPIGLNQGAIEQVYPNDATKLPEILAANQWTPTEGVIDNDIPKQNEQQWWSSEVQYPYKNPSIDNGVFTYKHPSASIAKEYKPSGSIVTFTIWFNHQMQRFQHINLPHDIKAIDNNVLRLLVQKILSANHIHISSDGIITNSKGIVIDLVNLELRPVFLGEKFQQNSLHSITIPKHLPFLEGILVTFVNPPHVLGIIPLGKTYLRKTTIFGDSLSGSAIVNDTEILLNNYGYANTSSYTSAANAPYTYTGANMGPISSYSYSSDEGNQIPSNSYSNVNREPLSPSYSYSTAHKKPYSGVSEASYWSSDPYVVQDSYPTSYWNVQTNSQPLGERRQLSKAKIKHHYAPPIPKNKKAGTRNMSGKPTKRTNAKADILREDDVLFEEFIKGNTSESGRRFQNPSLKGIMKTLLYLLNELPSRRDFNDGANSTEEVNIFNESESLKNEDGPDFRIIGGNAATGSGTPLSNKGRSGFQEKV